MKIIQCEQKSDAWYEARRGVPTASNFDQIITPKTMKVSTSSRKLACDLVGQLHYPGPMAELETYQSPAMKNGNALEAESRAAYSMIRDIDVVQVGFVMDDLGRFGCSPDGLVGNDGGMELKNPKYETHIRYLDDGVMPDDYLCQVHGSLIVTGRQWWDFVSYARGLPPFITRVTPNDFTQKLSNAMDVFWAQFAELRDKIQTMKDAS